MSEQLQTALEGFWVVTVLLGLLFFVGTGATQLLLPREWRGYELLLTPIIGWCLLVLTLFVVNLVVGVRLGIYVVIFLAAILNGFALQRSRHLASRARSLPALLSAPPAEKHRSQSKSWQPTAESLAPLFLGIGLIILALAPHVIQRSLGLLSLNTDEEVYYPAANYILNYPTIGGPHSLSERFLEGISLYGFAFQYTMAAASALSGSLPFQVYMPSIYCLLGLSVPAWYIFFREIYRLGRRQASLSCFFYSLLGLPLWFASYGYGPQMGSLVAIPLGTAAFVGALERGGKQRLALAGLSIATGLTSYYRGIGLHYVFTLLPVAVLMVMQKRNFIPLRRAVAVAGLALLLGLPSHWHVANWYFIRGAIQQVQDIGDNWSEGWGVTDFEPPSTALGMKAYVWVHDAEGSGPLAFLGPVLTPFAEPVSWIILAVAIVGAVRMARRESRAAAVLLGFLAYLLVDRFVLDFKYGYLKLLAVSGPLAYGLVVIAATDLWSRRKAWHLRAAVAALFLVSTAYLAYNSYETFWFSAKGWGLSIPNEVASGLHNMGKLIEPGSKVFIAGRFQYPTPPDRIQIRKNHIFAMQSVEELRNRWAMRIRAMAMAELLHADVYGWFDTEQVWRGYHHLLPDEDYDYYLLGPDNDPRVEGLDLEDKVWSEGGISLYRSRDTVRESPWTLWRKRGSLAVSIDKPFTVGVTSHGFQFAEGLSEMAGPASEGRLRVGILAFSKTEARVQIGEQSQWLTLEQGVTWYTTPTIPLPSTIQVQPIEAKPLGIVSLRLLGPGSEGTDFVPESAIRDDIYASSTVLRLDHWLTDPFRGKAPGSL